MATYVAIDQGYYPTKISTQQKLLEFSSHYHTKDGKKITAKDIKEMGKNGTLKLWSFSDEELKDVLDGDRISKDWEYIIHRL